MPAWNEVLQEIARTDAQIRSISPLDMVRRSYLEQLHKETGRNIIAYYSGWLQRPSRNPSLSISDDDMNAFMMCVHKMDCKKGLDLIIHTPGGSIPAIEAIVKYLRSKFGTDIRAFVPQLAMSAGTMMACSAKEIWMGKQSSLGPIDPQLNNIPCRGVVNEFEQAIQEIQKDPSRLAAWQLIIGKYHPTFLGECQRLITWSETMVADWLMTGMFAKNSKRKTISDGIAKSLSDHGANSLHSRHISMHEAQNLGLKIKELEKNQALQDFVLTIHHAFCHTFAQAPAVKIVENHLGSALVSSEQVQR